MICDATDGGGETVSGSLMNCGGAASAMHPQESQQLLKL